MNGAKKSGYILSAAAKPIKNPDTPLWLYILRYIKKKINKSLLPLSKIKNMGGEKIIKLFSKKFFFTLTK